MTDPNFPDRPDHPDFWLMAEVVQDLDNAADDGLSADRIVADLDMTSVAYMAEQRALRAQAGGMVPAALWFDAFVMGVMFQRRKSSKTPDIWLMELNLTEGGGYVTAHHTEEGAFRALVDKCRRLGIAVICDTYRDMVQIGELDDEPDIEDYGISKLPVNE